MSNGGRRCAILDIETAPDHHAQVLSRRSGSAPKGSPVHEVVNASVLTFIERRDGSLDRFDLTSWHVSEYGERDILANVERALSAVVADGGYLSTFNGMGHDLPTLRMRQLRWWMCEAEAIARIQTGEIDHIDVMHELSGGGEARWPTLADACASVGFSLRGPAVVGARARLPPELEKCELDCIGTAILTHYLLVARRRSSEPLSRGLPAFGRFVRSIALTRPHLERFALSRLLADDATAWGAAA